MIKETRKEYLEKVVEEIVADYAKYSYDAIGEIDYWQEVNRINSGVLSVLDLVFEVLDDSLDNYNLSKEERGNIAKNIL